MLRAHRVQAGVLVWPSGLGPALRMPASLLVLIWKGEQ